MAENTRFIKIEILNETKQELKKTVQSSLNTFEEKLDRERSAAKILSMISIGLATLGLLGVAWILMR